MPISWAAARASAISPAMRSASEVDLPAILDGLRQAAPSPAPRSG